ncbi:DCTN4 protein, partial [Polypterus senegalus]
MASLLQPDRVLYLVSGEKKIRSPLSQLYFCRYCSELRSLECVSHEVDSHYCPSCLENMPSAEAKLKKNRCANCFDCPCCMHTLSTRATNIPAPLADDPAKTTMKKAYYLACGFCRWTSRDVGMADKSVGEAKTHFMQSQSSDIPRDRARPKHIKPPCSGALSKLIEYYQQLAQREKVERDRKKLARRRAYMPLAFSEKYGLGTRLQRQRSGAPISSIAGLSLKENEDQKEIKIEPAQALEEVEPLPEDYYTRPINLPEVTTLRQRLLQPDFQPICASQLYPRHKHLLIKRSLRCRVVLSPKELVLAGKDAAAEYDELAEPQDFQDDPDIVAFRKSNKIGFFIKVTPQQEEGEVTVSFKLRHDFRNLATPIRPMDEGEQGTEAVWLVHHVELSLGPLAA